MIKIFRGSALVHRIIDSTDFEVGVGWVRTVDPGAFQPTAVPVHELPGGRDNYENNGIRGGRRMIGSNGVVYLVVAVDETVDAAP